MVPVMPPHQFDGTENILWHRGFGTIIKPHFGMGVVASPSPLSFRKGNMLDRTTFPPKYPRRFLADTILQAPQKTTLQKPELE